MTTSNALSSDQVRRIAAESFAPLDELLPGFANRVVRYVCDGEDEAVLDVLAGTTGSGMKIGLDWLYPRYSPPSGPIVPRRPWDDLLDSAEHLPLVTLLRLAKALQGAARSPAPTVLFQGRLLTPQVPFHHFQSPLPAWLDIFVRLATRQLDGLPPGTNPGDRLPASLVERLLELDGLCPDVLYEHVFPSPKPGVDGWLAYTLRHLRGFADRLADRPEIVSVALTQPEVRLRSSSLSLFQTLGLPVGPLVEPLASLAAGPSERLRGEASAMLMQVGPLALPPLKVLAETGTPAMRGHALTMIDRLGLHEGLAYLQSRVGVEKSAPVRQVLEELVGKYAATRQENPVTATAPAFPQIDPIAVIDLVGESLAAVRAWLEARFSPHAEAQLAHLLSPRSWVEGPTYPPNAMPLDQDEGLKHLLERPDLTTLHMVRLLRLSQVLQPYPLEEYNPVFLASPIDPLDALITLYRESHTPRIGLRELAAAFSASALDPDLLANLWYRHRDGRFLQWEPEAVWPYFADRVDWLTEEIDRGVKDDTFMRFLLGHDWRILRALAILKLFPQVPEGLVPRIWRLAEGGKHTLRPAARRILEKLPETHGRLLELLADGKADRRAAAAEWLGQWKPPGAAEALREAMGSEKVASVRTAIGRALESMGLVASPSGKGDQAEAVERLRKEAARGLKNGVPEKLAWFPFDRLPEIRWRHDEAPVEPLVPSWLVVSAWKAKSAEPSTDLLSHAASLRQEDLRGLGRSVFMAWLVEDLKPLPEAARREHLNDLLGIFGVGSVDDLLRAHPEMAEAIERLKEAPGKGNVADRGLLAVVAAAGPTEVVTPIRDYINKWYGYRAWQCRALVTVLAWIDSPEAVAFLLDVAKRFRTATIRKEAEVQARRLAERRRMTLAELSDVSVPDAGLDATGRVVLDFGPRRFVARLDDDAEVLLEDEGGKVVKALPSSAKSDDAEKAAAAKTRLAALKKEVKSIRKRVEDRLQEALCTQRSWTFSGWQSSLLRHPIAGRLCRRAVWTATSGDGPPVTFRPLEDGSLTDLDDNPVEPAAGAEVRLAHRLTIGNELTDRWAGHLSDYEITPLFPQAFGIASRLPADLRMEATWRFHAETPVSLTTLGRRARSLGYDPGAFRLEDGGDRFLRHFPSVSLCASIELADIEEADKVTKLNLSFLRAAEGQDARAGKRIALAEVPEVLLSECIADLSRMAGAGLPDEAQGSTGKQV